MRKVVYTPPPPQKKIPYYVQMVIIYIKIYKDFPFLDVNKVHTKQHMPQRLLCVK